MSADEPEKPTVLVLGRGMRVVDLDRVPDKPIRGHVAYVPFEGADAVYHILERWLEGDIGVAPALREAVIDVKDALGELTSGAAHALAIKNE